MKERKSSFSSGKVFRKSVIKIFFVVSYNHKYPDFNTIFEIYQATRSKRLYEKTDHDGMDMSCHLETLEDKNTSSPVQQTTTLSNILENTTLCEITQSTSLTSLDITTLREDTPSPVIQSIQEALIITPNKLIITKTMYDKYSTYLICAFNSTINYVKETVEEGIYIEIKRLLQMKDRLILQETFVKNLEGYLKQTTQK